MDPIHPWLGDLNELPSLRSEWVGLLCILVSATCGAVIGIERERRDKPAGLRTLILIAVGTTIFTLVSLLLARQKAVADPARLAAQIIPGIGFLGAGAIIQARGAVRGLTTGATIWAVAAVGVAIGSGYVAAGVVFTVLILVTLTAMRSLERLIAGPCRIQRASIAYRPDRGKARARIQQVLDDFSLPDDAVRYIAASDDERRLELDLCVAHREHRSALGRLAAVPEVVSIELGHEKP